MQRVCGTFTAAEFNSMCVTYANADPNALETTIGCASTTATFSCLGASVQSATDECVRLWTLASDPNSDLGRALLTVDNSTSTSTDTTDDDESDKAWFALLGLLILPIGLLAACFCVNQQKKKDEEYAKQPDLYKEPLVKEKPIYQENIAYDNGNPYYCNTPNATPAASSPQRTPAPPVTGPPASQV
jgi:hypothetical protein